MSILFLLILPRIHKIVNDFARFFPFVWPFVLSQQNKNRFCPRNFVNYSKIGKSA